MTVFPFIPENETRITVGVKRHLQELYRIIGMYVCKYPLSKTVKTDVVKLDNYSPEQ